MAEPNASGMPAYSHLSASDSLLHDHGQALEETGERISSDRIGSNSSQDQSSGLARSSGADTLNHEKRAATKSYPSRRRSFKQAVKDWRWELLACVFSLICMGTIIGILAAFQNRSLRHWKLPSGISPNAVVSIFATLSKSAMLLVLGEGISHLKWIYFQQRGQRLLHMQTFDEASRGPWGALILLKRIRWRAGLAAGGAILVVLALAFDPFAQQVLSFPMRNVEDVALNATIGKARNYDSGVNMPGSSVLSTGDPQGTPLDIFFSWQDAILRGIYVPDDQAKHTCSTGNCTWSEFDTLAICSRCTDVSRSLSRSCHMGTTVDSCIGMPPDVHCEYITTQNCTYTFPNGAIVKAGATSGANGDGSWVDSSQLAVLDRTQLNMSVLLSNASAEAPLIGGLSPLILANISSLWFAPNYAGNWTLPTAHGHECDLSWCVETHQNTSCRNGILTDKSMATRELVFWTCSATEDYNVTPMYCMGFTHDQIPEKLKTSAPPDNMLLNTHPDLLRDPNVWKISPNDQYALYYEISTLLTTAYGHGNNSFLANTIARANSGNIPRTMDDIAGALTLRVRQGPNSTSHKGTTYVMEAYIEVNWYWIVLPLALTLLAAGFLIACILCNMEYGQSPWKSSALAVLLHGLDEPPRSNVQLSTEDSMDTYARGASVRLEEDTAGHVSLSTGMRRRLL